MTTPIFYTVNETMEILRIGRSLFYELVNSKKLKIVKLSGKTLIRKDDLDAFISGLSGEVA